MKITIKELKGKECVVQVEPGWSVAYLKGIIAGHIKTTPECQRLILRGKVLKDEESLESSGVTNDSRIIVTEKKPSQISQTQAVSTPQTSKDNDFWQQLHVLLKRHFSETDAALVLDQCRKEFKMMTSSLSLDDIERLAGALVEQR